MPLTRKRFLGLAGRGALGAAAYSTFGFLDRGVAGSSADGKPCSTQPPTKEFIYRGKAIGVSANITAPLPGDLQERPKKYEDQAVAALTERGGHDEKRAVDFRVPGIAYVSEAYSLVTGNPDLKNCRPVFRTFATATVRGLDVDAVVRADTIVANLESQQPEEGTELEMLPVGYFSNLRIRDYPIELRPRVDYLVTLMTRSKKSEIDKEIGDEIRRIDREMESEIAREGGPRCEHAYPGRLGESTYECSIFSDKSIRAAVRKIPGVTACKGGRIHVEDLGDVYLGRLVIHRDEKEEFRRLTMLRIVLASPPSGDMSFASVEGDGRPR